jgi:methyl-accepting chemotaxis protein
MREKYKSIDENISKLDDDAEHNAKIANEHGVEVAHHTATANGLFVLIGTFLGTFLSLLIVRGLSSTLGKTIADLNASSDAVSSASVQSSASATELSEASTQQAASLQQTMASVEQISAMVSQNAESAGKVQGAVDLNQQSADEGSKSVGDMMTAIDEIKVTNDKILTQMEESNREFGAIVKIISEIGEKTKVINDIVFQTKLLSFNASVEAARAGEHGKGFAVVAEEVGNLAQMSGNAAKQITDMLSDSIKKVNEIVDQTTRRVDQLVEVGKDKISMGQATAQRCREALSKISNNAQTMATMIGEITHASKEQAQGVQEINKAMSQLDQVTQQNAAVAQQSSQQAELLNSQAQSLSSAVSSLVSLVNGGNSHAEVPQAGPRAKVTPIAHARAAHKAAPARTAKMKQAVGARTPSANDPAFEEF